MLAQAQYARITADRVGFAGAHEHWDCSLRELHAGDVDHLRAHLLRLDAGSRRARFGNPASDRFVEEYVARVDFAGTRVLGCFVDGEARGVAEIRSLARDWSREAEIAISVERGWQARGIGTALLAQLIHGARELDVDHLYLSYHVFDAEAVCIAERLASKVRFEDCECFADIGIRWLPVAAALDQHAGAARPRTWILVLDL
jgi:GNAT superfamily N-acetyltransferase